MNYLLDTSAWLVHLFGENGAEEINAIFDDVANDVFISVLSLPELYARLKALDRQGHWPEVWKLYSALFAATLPVDEATAQTAIQLRTAAPSRLPTIDGVIAATAAVNNMTLVHRDPHLAGIPGELLSQMLLPPK
jgi:predicted nucleic acid-binding protein